MLSDQVTVDKDLRLPRVVLALAAFDAGHVDDLLAVAGPTYDESLWDTVKGALPAHVDPLLPSLRALKEHARRGGTVSEAALTPGWVSKEKGEYTRFGGTVVRSLGMGLFAFVDGDKQWEEKIEGMGA